MAVNVPIVLYQNMCITLDILHYKKQNLHPMHQLSNPASIAKHRTGNNSHRLQGIRLIYPLFILLILCLNTTISTAQPTSKGIPTDNTIQPNDLKALQTFEDTLKVLAYHVLRDSIDEERYYACQALIKTFAQALKIDNSFFYKFDSVRNVSIMYPQDSAFRILTWQLYVSADEYKYYGAIQMRSKALELYPLSDRSELLTRAENKTVDHKNWYGAVYYNIKQVNTGTASYYTLFGLDAFALMSRRKVIDVLYFDENGMPKFGAPIFVEIDPREQTETVKHRVILEYSAQGAVSCNYNEEYDLIIFDNLIRVPSQFGTLMSVSDGSYRGYKFDAGRWLFIEKVFNDFQERAPREQPVLNGRKDGLFGPTQKKKRKRRKKKD